MIDKLNMIIPQGPQQYAGLNMIMHRLTMFLRSYVFLRKNYVDKQAYIYSLN